MNLIVSAIGLAMWACVAWAFTFDINAGVASFILAGMLSLMALVVVTE